MLNCLGFGTQAPAESPNVVTPTHELPVCLVTAMGVVHELTVCPVTEAVPELTVMFSLVIVLSCDYQFCLLIG